MKRLISVKMILLIAILAGCKAPNPPAPIIKAKALVEGDKEMIAFFAHPTASLQSAEYINSHDENTSFKLVYKFNLVSAIPKTPFDSTLGFVFDKQGFYQRSAVEGTTSKTVKPYTAATQAIPGRKYAKILKIINPNIKFVDAQGIQDFILKNGGSEAVFRETGSPWKQRP